MKMVCISLYSTHICISSAHSGRRMECTRMPHKLWLWIFAVCILFALELQYLLVEDRSICEVNRGRGDKGGEEAGMPEVGRRETWIFVNISLLRAFIHLICITFGHTTKTILCIASRMKISYSACVPSFVFPCTHTHRLEQYAGYVFQQCLIECAA